MAKKKIVETEQTTQVAVVMPDIFTGVDFTTLNASITALANHNSTLTENDKAFAVETISSWEKSVIQRLNQKNVEASNLLYSLMVNNPICITDDEFEALVTASGTEDLYQDYLDKVDKLENLKGLKPEAPVIDLTTTLEEQLTSKRDYDLEVQKLSIQISKAEREVDSAMKTLKKTMNEHEGIKELTSRVRKYQRNINKFKNECEDKSQLAKISVTIASKEIREALKDLLNFSITM